MNTDAKSYTIYISILQRLIDKRKLFQIILTGAVARCYCLFW